MSAKRPPAPPPQLPGFTFIDVLGSGGFADVYLYEQHLPRRRVAVKVMLPERMAGSSAEQFAAEANVMALLSTHPAIVTIYQAGVSEDGRPYLVMEYCPRPNLQVRSRSAAFSVAEALRVGIQVGAAVETAHRAGILHRDIKPANILVTEYNRPALTDFGIATTAEAADSSAGMSIPWSPPESFADVPESGVRSDVYALGATVYTLLAGRSPFEVPGGRNGAADLIQRIETWPAPRLDRADAPESLQVALERTLAKRPVDRFESAVAFARALQRVQIELAHSVTPIDILDDAPIADDPDDEGGELTRVRGIVSIEPQTSPAAGPTRRRAEEATFGPDSAPSAADAVDETVLRTPPPVVADTTTAAATVVRSAPAAATPASPAMPTNETMTSAPTEAAAGGGAVDTAVDIAASSRSRRRWGLGIGIGAAALVLIGGGVALASALTPAPQPEPSESAAVVPQDPDAGFVPSPAELAGTVDGDTATFTWTNPDPQEGDSFQWAVYTVADGAGEPHRTDETSIDLPLDGAAGICIEVYLRRADGSSSSEPKRECTP